MTIMGLQVPMRRFWSTVVSGWSSWGSGAPPPRQPLRTGFGRRSPLSLGACFLGLWGISGRRPRQSEPPLLIAGAVLKTMRSSFLVLVGR